MPVCRLLPYAVADGPYNMAADEALLVGAGAGTAALRLYGWFPPTLSLGYFQPERLRHSDPLLAGLPYVRRPSGGDTLVHHHEVTYALAVPAGPTRPADWLGQMHRVLAAALESLGIRSYLYEPAGARRFEGPLCFRHFTAGDLLIDGVKAAGSAQRRHRGALLQHGALLLARSPHTPSLPGIRELTGRTLDIETTCHAVEHAFARLIGWELIAADWSAEERQLIQELVRSKYTRDEWNRKR
jgi:lipoate-protein ligase A